MMGQDTKHTPLPWELFSINPPSGPEADLYATVDGRGLTIATINTRLPDWEANARLLRDACNSHAELAEACEAVIHHADCPNEDECERIHNHVARARAAIAKAQRK